MSIAACYNVYNDADALRGSLELAQSYFDNIYVIHSGPDGAVSNDGTIELCESFGIKPVMDNINEGYGVIRTRLIHDCGCDWAFILDADERFYPSLPMMFCNGSERYPEVSEPDLSVRRSEDLINPGQYLKSMIASTKADAIRSIRRHWFDFSMTRPCENWEIRKDYQLRIVRNKETIIYQTERRMHEHLVDTESGTTPQFREASETGGPFHDHFHMFFRRAKPGHKEGNEEYYARLERGEV